MFKKLLLALSFSIATAGVASAATVTQHEGYLKFSGEVTIGDSERLKRAIERTNITTVFFNSPGGVAVEGFKMGVVLKEKEATVVIQKGDACMSACANAFLAGKTKVLNGLLGFHIAHIPTESEKLLDVNTSFASGQQMGSAFVAYFFEMGYNMQLVTLINGLTNKETFFTFKKLEDLERFRFNDETPFNNIRPLDYGWVADRIAGPLRLQFLKAS